MARNIRRHGEAVAALAGAVLLLHPMLPAARVLDLVEAFEKTIRGDLRSDEPWVAVPQHVLAADREGIDAQLPGDLVDLLFAGKRDLRLAEGGKSPEAPLVGGDQPALALRC